MKENSLRTVLAFTLAYGVLALALLAAQPSPGRMQTADAGGNFEAPAGSFYIRLASAE